MSFRVFPLSFQSGIKCPKGLSHRVRSSIFVLTALASAGLGFASANTIDMETLTQLMIEDEGQDVYLLGLEFGVSGVVTPIHFSSDVDGTTSTYSYDTVAGSTYLGEPLSIGASAVFNSTTDTVTTTSTTTLGATSYTTTATNVIDLLADPKTDLEKRNIPPMMIGPYTVNDEEWETTEYPDGRTTDKVFYTFNGMRIPHPPVPSADRYIPLTGAWSFDQVGTFEVVSSGFSPITGGAGTFTSSIVIPEPSTWAMMLVGFAGLAFAGFRSRKRAAAPAV